LAASFRPLGPSVNQMVALSSRRMAATACRNA